MGKGLGIAGLILAIIGIFLPVVGIFIGWVALALVAFGALSGERTFATAVVAVSVVNYLFLSPSLWLAAAGVNFNHGLGSLSIPVTITVVLVLAPIAAMILHATGKVVIGK
jgi:hypothetical protein